MSPTKNDSVYSMHMKSGLLKRNKQEANRSPFFRTENSQLTCLHKSFKGHISVTSSSCPWLWGWVKTTPVEGRCFGRPCEPPISGSELAPGSAAAPGPASADTQLPLSALEGSAVPAHSTFGTNVTFQHCIYGSVLCKHACLQIVKTINTSTTAIRRVPFASCTPLQYASTQMASTKIGPNYARFHVVAVITP